MDIFFFDTEIVFIYSLDMSYLVSTDSKNELMWKRGDSSWINEILNTFLKGKGKRIIATREKSIYTECQDARIEKRPFSDYFVKECMPIKFEFSQARTISVSANYVLANISVRMDKEGTFSIRYRVIPKDRKICSKVDQAVNEIEQIRTKIQDRIEMDINRFAQFWNQSYEKIVLNVPKNVLSNIHSYEIILFDYKTSERKIPIKHMFESKKLDLGRQLIGFARMDRPDVWNKHSKEFISKFSQKDIGTRVDEFWLIDYQRFLRYFPKRREEVFEAWFEDALCGIEILLHRKALLEYVYEWSNKKLLKLEKISRRALTREKEHKSVIELSESINKDIIEINNMAKIISDPLSLKRHSPFQFYRELINFLINEVGLDELLDSVRNQFFEIYRFYDSTKKSIDSILAIELQRSASKFAVLLEALSLFFGALVTGEIASTLATWYFKPEQLQEVILWTSMPLGVVLFIVLLFLKLLRTKT